MDEPLPADWQGNQLVWLPVHAIYQNEVHSVRKVKQYMEMMLSGSEPPPVWVRAVKGNKFVLDDGAHRLCAARSLGRKKIYARLCL